MFDGVVVVVVVVLTRSFTVWVSVQPPGRAPNYGNDPTGPGPVSKPPNCQRLSPWQDFCAHQDNITVRESPCAATMVRATRRVGRLCRVSKLDSEPFRVLLLRRLRLPLPFTVCTCQCGRPLDAFGHHRAARSTGGRLGRRGFAAESAIAQIFREGGARVSTNVMVRDLDITPPHRSDLRRLEVVAEGLTLFGG